MGEVNAVVEYSGFAKDQILRTDLVVLLGVFAAIKPSEICDGSTVRKVSHNPLLSRSHGEGLETEYFSDDLYERHIPRQFVNSINLRTVHILIRIVLQQITIGLNAEFVAQHLLAVRPHAWQVFDILV